MTNYLFLLLILLIAHSSRELTKQRAEWQSDCEVMMKNFIDLLNR